MAKLAQTLNSRLLHAGRVFRLSVDDVRLPNNRTARLDVIRHPGSVVLLPMPDADHIVLVRQYRYAVDRMLWELPAGGIEAGEAPEAAAARECHEEIGLVPTSLRRLGVYLPTPGYSDETMQFYRLDGLVAPAAPAAPDADEVLEASTWRLAEARQMVASGEIMDMKTALGLSLLV